MSRATAPAPCSSSPCRPSRPPVLGVAGRLRDAPPTTSARPRTPTPPLTPAPTTARGAAPNPAAPSVRPAGPAGVDEPAPDVALRDLLDEELRVHARPKRHEGRAEAGAEGRRRLGHPRLRAGDLGRVAGDEVVHRLLRGEPGDGG